MPKTKLKKINFKKSNFIENNKFDFFYLIFFFKFKTVFMNIFNLFLSLRNEKYLEQNNAREVVVTFMRFLKMVVKAGALCLYSCLIQAKELMDRSFGFVSCYKYA